MKDNFLLYFGNELPSYSQVEEFLFKEFSIDIDVKEFCEAYDIDLYWEKYVDKNTFTYIYAVGKGVDENIIKSVSF